MLGFSVVGSGRLGVVGGRVVGLAVVVVVWLLVGGGVAWATTGHGFVGQFGGAGDGDGQFGGGAVGVGVVASSGDVLTVDEGQGATGSVARVQRFGADGGFVSRFAVDPSYAGGLTGFAVDPVGAGAVYVATGANGGVPSVVKYSMAGVLVYALNAGAASINAGARVAVDPVDGSVYVTVTDALGAQAIGRFDPVSGLLISTFDGAGSPGGGFGVCLPLDMAVDGSHRVYVLDACNRVDRYSALGVYEASLDPQLAPRDDGAGAETLWAVAADPVSDEVYVAHSGPRGTQVTHFSAGGTGVVYTFDALEAGGVLALAVGGGTVYTSDSTKPFVERFGRFDGPTVVTGAASSIAARSAVLEGTINPEGVSASYYFEYGLDRRFGHRVPAVARDAGNGSVVVAASEPVDGLEANKPYVFRLVGVNASGSIAGASGSFTTLPAPPEVGPSFASAVTPRSVRLHGTANPNNSFMQWHVEYGTTTAYGTTSPEDFLAAAGTDQPMIFDAARLEPGTVYHFRFVATAGFLGLNPQFGADQTFITAPAAGGGATGVTAGRATLTGTINSHGVATTYHFNYGPTTRYGSSTSEAAGGSGDGDQPVAQAISGLLPDTTYHVQVVATSTDGVIRSGADGLFRTAPAATAVVIGPTEISTNAATLAGDVNTFGVTGSYHFNVWSLDSSYTMSTVERAVAGNASVERVSAVVSGLPAGETFVVQLRVSSNDAVSTSDLDTFATAAVPTVFPAPPGSDGVSVYGCASPRLNAFTGRPKPGETVTISGLDLGVGGNVMLGDRSLKPTDWSTTGFKVVVPEDATGSLALTVNCGRQSNTITLAVFHEPDNRFAITGRTVTGSSATLRVRVPGPGKLESSGAGTRAAKVTIKKPGTTTIKLRLTKASRDSRKVKVRVRYTPAGGRPASKTVTITFKHKGRR